MLAALSISAGNADLRFAGFRTADSMVESPAPDRPPVPVPATARQPASSSESAWS